MKSFFQKFPVLIIYLLTSIVLFAIFIFAFSSTDSGGEFECQNLSHTYTCSADEANSSAIAWAIMLQVFAQSVLVPAAIILQVVHWLLRRKFQFFDTHPYWSLVLLVLLFFIVIVGVILFKDSVDALQSTYVRYRFSV